MRKRSTLRTLLGLLVLTGGLYLLSGKPVPAYLPGGPDSTDVRWTLTNHNGPVTWDSCAPVHVAINPGPFEDSAYEEIHSALDEIADTVGVRFSVHRTDSFLPTSRWALEAPGDYGAPPPVLIGWVDAADTDMLGGDTAGSTVANPQNTVRGRYLVTGAIALDAAQYERFESGTGAGKTRRNLLLHELGHMLGLDHVDSTASLMNPVVGKHSPDGFSAEEITFLRERYGSCRRGN